MASPGSFQLFSYVYENFDNVMRGHIGETVAKLSSSLSGVAYTLFGIYIMLWGISMLRNMINEPVMDGVMRILKVSVVMGFAINTGIYLNHVVGFFMNAPEAMANLLVIGDGSESANIGTTADGLVSKALDTADSIWAQAGILNGNIGHYAIGSVFIGAALIICSVAFMMILVAKFSLVFMLALGPMFIIMSLFNTTQKFFEAWLSQVITFMLTIIFVGAAVSLIFSMFGQVTQWSASQVAEKKLLAGGAQMSAVAVIGTWLLFQVGSMASAVAGGVNLGISQFTGKMHGGGIVDAAQRKATNRALNAGSKAVSAGLAKATGGASVAASHIANAFRATNSVRRG